MADILPAIRSADAATRLKDMGDGTHAPVISAVLGTTPNSPTNDAFGRLRVGNPTNLFESTLVYDKHRILWEESLTGGAAADHITNQSTVRLRVSSDGDLAIRQSRAYFYYHPGKSQLIAMTGILGDPVAGVEQRIGYFDSNNGLFFLQCESGPAVVRRTYVTGSAVDNEVFQADWNIDTLDGHGPSGLTLDLAAAQIFVIDLQWLGVGRVRFGFDINGQVVYCHEMLNANSLTSVYMTTAALPVRYEIEAVSAEASQAGLYAICAPVTSEGGAQLEIGVPFSANNGVTAISVNAEVPLISIRPKATFNSVVNRGLIIPEGLKLSNQDEPALWEIVYGGTLTDPSFSSVNDDSITEFDVAASAVAGGIVIDSGYVVASSLGAANLSQSIQQALKSITPLTLNIAGDHPTTPYTDVLTLRAQTIGDVTSGMAGSLSWRELR